MNLDKFVVCFNPNTSEEAKSLMQEALGIPGVNCHEKYLGLPTLVGRNKKRMFGHLKEKVYKMVKTSKERSLSKDVK